MKTNRKSVIALLNLGVAAIGLSTAMPALAQETAANDAGNAYDDIIVTARRRAESLQDVPLSVSAFSAEALEQRGAPDITTLQQTTPNLTLQVARGSNSTLIAFIRGVGQQDPLWGFEPGVGLYVDDVYIARPQGAVLDIFDIERIEVLRGPQGTLYGRNTIGGAVKYVTKRLADEPTFKIRGAYGSYDQRELVTSGSMPLGDKVAVGAALAIYKRDGFGKNLNTGAEHYNKDVIAGRVSVEFTPTEDLSIRLAADRTDDESNARHGYRELPGVAGNPPVLDDVYDTNAGLGDDNNVETQGVSGTIEWNVNDVFTLKSITAYREGNTQTNIDFDGTPAGTLDVPAYYKDNQFSQELQVQFSTDRLQGVAGLYYMDSMASGAFDTVAGAFGISILTSGRVDTKSFAAFTDFSYDLTDKFAVSLGGRYTRDKKDGTVYRANYLGNRSPAFGGPDVAPLLVRTDYSNDRTFEEFTPRVSLSYKATDDVNLYASYGRGFKSGGFDMRGDAILTPSTVDGYDPETVDSFELGMKGSFLDRRVMLNLAGFYSKYKGQQITTQVPNLSGGIASFVDNVGKSEIWGLELEGRVTASEHLFATFAVGYIKTKFEQFLTYDLASGQYIDVSDQRVFQNTPKWTANLSTTYTRDLPNDMGNMALTGSVSLRSDYSMFETPTPVLDQDGYALVDLSLVWTSTDEHWQVGLHGRNLTDKQYRVGGYNFGVATYNNSVIGFYGPPRTFTGTVEFRF